MLVDADGCPVTRIAVRVAAEYGVLCVVFCDMAHEFRELGSSVEVVTVSTGADSADFALVNRAERGDIVVTQDFGLAAMCRRAALCRLTRTDGFTVTTISVCSLSSGILRSV